MVGDTRGDEKAARDNAVRFAFAAYGFGHAETMDYRLEKFSDLAMCL
jgi:phosphoglycolate phosphatase-like HAD superfamily hydrolase